MPKNSDSANKITADILLRVSEELPNVILWRQNAGMGLPLAYVKAALGCLRRGDVPGAIKALSSRPFRAGVTGTADLSGIALIEAVEWEHGTYGIRVEVEVKTENDRQNEDQKRFQSMILAHAGIYLIATDADQCVTDLRARLAEF